MARVSKTDMRRHRFNRRTPHKPKLQPGFEITPELVEELSHLLNCKGHSEKTTVKLDRKLVEGIDDILQQRGGNIEAFLELQMVGFVRSKSILGLGDTFNFGKYNSVPVEHVIKNDLAYMYWLVVEQKSKKFKQEVYDRVVSLADEEDGDWRFLEDRG